MNDAETPESIARRMHQAVMTVPGDTSLELRAAIERQVRGIGSNGAALDPAVSRYVDGVVSIPVRGDVATLLEKGMSEDEVFEITLVAAVNAGAERLEQGLSVLERRK